MLCARAVIHGIETNLGYLAQARRVTDAFTAAGPDMTTASLDELDYRAGEFRRAWKAARHTTVQSWPGRQGYWNVGVPPSGPMDDLSFRLGNRLAGQRPGRGRLWRSSVQGPHPDSSAY